MNINFPAIYILLSFNLLPQAVDFPFWISVASWSFLSWRLLSEFLPVPLPGRGLILVFALLCMAGVVNQFDTLLGEEASRAALMLLVGLKAFEVKNYRDVMVLTYLCFFLLMTNLLNSQSLGITIYLVIDVILIVAFLIFFHVGGDQREWKKLLRRSSLLFLQGLPLVALLFFGFPRFKAQFWNRNGEQTAKSGFSGELRPGSISQMALSDEPVFRVYFPEGVELPLNQMYWRGIVLSRSQGLSWTWVPPSGAMDRLEPSEIKNHNELVRHEIYLEPHGQQWLFALDWPMGLSFSRDSKWRSWVQFSDRSLRMRSSLRNREYYLAYSQPISAKTTWPAPDASYLDVESIKGAEKSKALAEEIKTSARTSAEVVQGLLQFFGQGGFRYTLNPPLVKTMDQFLYESKAGFCEHYAAVFATLLRWAGIPSRVVLGYQGGTDSFLKDYLLVRQWDAHAWVEFWDGSSNSWKRVDPTVVVAPERVSIGGENYSDFYASGEKEALLESWFSSHKLPQFFVELSLLFDQVESAWIGFLLKYDFAFQEEILRAVGWVRVSPWQLLFICFSLIASVVLVWAWKLAQGTRRLTSSQKLYRDLCWKLEKKGLPRRDNEGPLSFKERALEAFPEQKEELQSVFQDLIHLRYGHPYEEALSFQAVKQKVEKLD